MNDEPISDCPMPEAKAASSHKNNKIVDSSDS